MASFFIVFLRDVFRCIWNVVVWVFDLFVNTVCCLLLLCSLLAPWLCAVPTAASIFCSGQRHLRKLALWAFFLTLLDWVAIVHCGLCLLTWRSCQMVKKMCKARAMVRDPKNYVGFPTRLRLDDTGSTSFWINMELRRYPIMYLWAFLSDVPFVALTALSAVFVWRIPDAVRVLRWKHREERSVNWRLVGLFNLAAGLGDLFVGVAMVLVTVTLWRLPKMLRDLRKARADYGKHWETVHTRAAEARQRWEAQPQPAPPAQRIPLYGLYADLGFCYNKKARCAVLRCAGLVMLEFFPALAWILAAPVFCYRWQSVRDSCDKLNRSDEKRRRELILQFAPQGVPGSAPLYDGWYDRDGEAADATADERRVRRVGWRGVGAANIVLGLCDLITALAALLLVALPWRLPRAVEDAREARRVYRDALRSEPDCSLQSLAALRYNAHARAAVVRHVILGLADLGFAVLCVWVLLTLVRAPALYRRLRLVCSDKHSRGHDKLGRGWRYHDYRRVIAREAAKVAAMVVVLPLLALLLLTVYRIPVVLHKRKQLRQVVAIERAIKHQRGKAAAAAYAPTLPTPPREGADPESAVAQPTPDRASEQPPTASPSPQRTPPAGASLLGASAPPQSQPAEGPTPASVDAEVDDASFLRQVGLVCKQCALVVIDLPCVVAALVVLVTLWRAPRLCSLLKVGAEWGGGGGGTAQGAPAAAPASPAAEAPDEPPAEAAGGQPRRPPPIQIPESAAISVPRPQPQRETHGADCCTAGIQRCSRTCLDVHGIAAHNRAVALGQLLRLIADIPVIALFLVVAGTLYRLPGLMRRIAARTRKQADPTAVLALTSVISEFTPGQGWVLNIKGMVPPGFQFAQAFLHVQGADFWESFSRGIGRMASVVVHRFLPIQLCPHFLRPEDVCSTTGTFDVRVHIRVTVKRSTILKKLRKCSLTAPVCLRVEYAPVRKACSGCCCGGDAEGTLFVLNTTAGDIIEREESGRSLDLPPPPRGPLPMPDPERQQRSGGAWCCDVLWVETLWEVLQLPLDLLAVVALALLVCCAWRLCRTARMLTETAEAKRRRKAYSAARLAQQLHADWPAVLEETQRELLLWAKNTAGAIRTGYGWAAPPAPLLEHWSELARCDRALSIHAADAPAARLAAGRCAEAAAVQLLAWWDTLCLQLLELTGRGPREQHTPEELRALDPDAALRSWAEHRYYYGAPPGRASGEANPWLLPFDLAPADGPLRPAAACGRRPLQEVPPPRRGSSGSSPAEAAAEAPPPWLPQRAAGPRPPRRNRQAQQQQEEGDPEPVLLGLLPAAARCGVRSASAEAAENLARAGNLFAEAGAAAAREAGAAEQRWRAEPCEPFAAGWGATRLLIAKELGDAALDALAALAALVAFCCLWRCPTVCRELCAAGRKGWRRAAVLQLLEILYDFLHLLAWVCVVATLKHAVPLQFDLVGDVLRCRGIEACREHILAHLHCVADDFWFCITLLFKARTWKYLIVTLLTGMFAPAETLAQTFAATGDSSGGLGSAGRAALLLLFTAAVLAFPFVLSLALAPQGDDAYTAGVIAFTAAQLLLLLYSVSAQFRTALRPGSGAPFAADGQLTWQDCGPPCATLSLSEEGGGLQLSTWDVHTVRLPGAPPQHPLDGHAHSVEAIRYHPQQHAVEWLLKPPLSPAAPGSPQAPRSWTGRLPRGREGGETLVGIRVRAVVAGVQHDIPESAAPTPPHPLLRLHAAPARFVRLSWHNAMPVLAVLIEAWQLCSLPFLFDPPFPTAAASVTRTIAQYAFLDFPVSPGRSVGLWVAVICSGVFYVVAAMPVVLEDLMTTSFAQGAVARLPGWAFLSMLLSSVLYPLTLRSLIAAAWCPGDASCAEGAGWGMVALLCLTLYVPACALRGTKVRHASPELDVAYVELYNLAWTAAVTVIVAAAEALRHGQLGWQFAGTEALVLAGFAAACWRIRRHPEVPQLCSVSSIGWWRAGAHAGALWCSICAAAAQNWEDAPALTWALVGGVVVCAAVGIAAPHCLGSKGADHSQALASVTRLQAELLACEATARGGGLLRTGFVGDRWRRRVRGAYRAERIARLCQELEGQFTLSAYSAEFWGTRKSWRDKCNGAAGARDRLWSRTDLEVLEECVAELAACLARAGSRSSPAPSPAAESGGEEPPPTPPRTPGSAGAAPKALPVASPMQQGAHGTPAAALEGCTQYQTYGDLSLPRDGARGGAAHGAPLQPESAAPQEMLQRAAESPPSAADSQDVH